MAAKKQARGRKQSRKTATHRAQRAAQAVRQHATTSPFAIPKDIAEALRANDGPRAQALCEIALRTRPEHPGLRQALGLSLLHQRHISEAATVFQELAAEHPQVADVQRNLGIIYEEQADFTAAEHCFLRALELNPELVSARRGLARAYRRQGRIEESIAAYREVLRHKPDCVESRQGLVISLHYAYGPTRQELHQALTTAGQYDLDIDTKAPVNPIDRTPSRRLRIGVLSDSLHSHPATLFTVTTFEALDPEQVELFAYSDHAPNRADRTTRRLQDKIPHWRETRTLSDDALATAIRKDKIDILIDLSDHSTGGRVKTLTSRPAPIQVKWIGGQFNTTGKPFFDYFISDHVETPEGADEWYVEKLVRMPEGYACYAPPVYAPDVAELPARENGYITFGCFNNNSKINQHVVETWGQLLREVPNSRLLLKYQPFDDPHIVERYRTLFTQQGIAAARLDIRGYSKHQELLATYNEVDIALDPFPYAGGLTTCEAMWMGVPVVTLPGHSFASRHSATHLANVGLHEWIAEDRQDYIRIAREWAENLTGLSERRRTLRRQVARSPLCNAPRFARHLEAALREMWLNWLDGKTAPITVAPLPVSRPSDTIPRQADPAPITNSDRHEADEKTAAAKVDRACELIERLLEDGDLDQAGRLCLSVLSANPTHPQALYLAGQINHKEHATKEAIKLTERAIAQAPDRETFWRGYAELLTAAGLVENAEQARIRADAVVVIQAGRELEHAPPEHLANVIAQCETALAENPSDNAAFLLHTFALLAMPAEHVQANPDVAESLDDRIHRAGWAHKRSLYHYWLSEVRETQARPKTTLSAVVIANRYKPEIAANLRELRAQGDDRLQIIFVNNGCPNADFEPIRPYVDTWLRTHGNSGAYLARNLGALYATAPLLLFVDDDGLPETGFLTAHLEAHQRWDLVSLRGVYQPRSTTYEPPPHYRPADAPKPHVPDLEGNVSFPTQRFFELGGWSDYILFGHGGLEIAQRILTAGYASNQLGYTPDSVLHHDYVRGAEHAQDKFRKQRASGALIAALNPRAPSPYQEVAAGPADLRAANTPAGHVS